KLSICGGRMPGSHHQKDTSACRAWINPSRTHRSGRSAARYIALIGSGTAASVQLDVRGPDHLAPFLGFVGDQLAKIGRREREHVAAQVGKPRLELGIGKASVDLLVEL